MTASAGRRRLLRAASALGIAGSATPFALNLASLAAATAQTAPDYRALVCVFLYGANDAHNTVVPYDADRHAAYVAARGALAWPADALLELAPAVPAADGLRIAVPTALATIRSLWDQGRCAVVANVGPLVEPLDRARFLARSARLPPKLFSHNDQQSVWQAAVPEGARYGWGGRVGDALAAHNGAAALFTCMSLTGNAVFLSGQAVTPYRIDPAGGAIAFNGLGANLFGSSAASQALHAVLTRPRSHPLQGDLAALNARAIDARARIADALAATPAIAAPYTAANRLSEQLRMVARLVAARGALGTRRQVFMVSMGGFDTHADQATDHPALLATLDTAIAEFQAAIDEIGAAGNVTLFTASDFGRTLTINGDGTDHGWGAHHFVVGGSVQGGRLYGDWPDLAAGSAQDAGNGRLIPTTSVEQLAAALATWMGIPASELPQLLPNLPNFPAGSLGVMG